VIVARTPSIRPSNDAFQERSIQFMHMSRFGPWRIKVYALVRPGRNLRPELHAAALEIPAKCLPSGARAGTRFGAAFLSIRDDPDGSMISLRWWEGVHDLRHRAFLTLPSSVTPMYDCARSGYIADIWDIPLISFERDAWVRCVGESPSIPRLRQYFEARLVSEG
jgi:hypothetical protein